MEYTGIGVTQLLRLAFSEDGGVMVISFIGQWKPPGAYHRGLSLVSKSTRDSYLLVTKSQANLLGSYPPSLSPLFTGTKPGLGGGGGASPIRT